MSEHRRHERVAARFRAWCESGDITVYARVANVSEGGVFVQTSTPLPDGSRLKLRLPHRDGGEIVTEAVVVWSRDRGGDSVAGMGLAFDDMDERAREALRRLVTAEAERQRSDSADKRS